MVLAIGGVVLFAYSDGFTAANVEGVLLTLGAGFGAAVCKVWEGGGEGVALEQPCTRCGREEGRGGFGAAVYKVWEGGGEGWLWSSRVQGVGGRRGGGGFNVYVYNKVQTHTVLGVLVMCIVHAYVCVSL